MTINTPNGRLFSHEAIAQARSLAEAAGFTVEGMSERSQAVYMARGGRTNRLRIAGHVHDHADIGAELIMPDRVIDHIEVTESHEQGDGTAVTSMVEMIEVKHTGLLLCDVAELVADAIAEYDASEDEGE